MATSFSDVADVALITIQDYKLDKLYNRDQTAFENFLAGLVVSAVPLFQNSRIDLGYDLATQTFTNTLGNAEIAVLAALINMKWLERVVKNVTQISNTMTPSDAKRYSEAENLKQKSEFFDKERERAYQMMTDYEKTSIPFEKWANGHFF